MKDSIAEVTDEPIQKPVYLFGKDIREIKCFRTSFICGILSGLVGGLGCFLLTSKARLSTNVSVACLWIGVLCYWVPCRYKYESNFLLYEALRQKQLKIIDRPKTESEEKNQNTESAS